MITVNDQPVPHQEGMRLADLIRRHRPGADVALINGRPATDDMPIHDRDRITLIKSGEIPSALDMETALARRHGLKVQQRLRRSLVGIMGLGGLGSAVAVSLVKVGVGRLILADFDVVELSNLHRQHYFIDQIGMKKTTALKKTLVRINPFVHVTTLDTRLNEENIPRHFRDVDVLVECFDDPVMKATALRTVLTRMPETGYVGASGMAGLGPGNTILSHRLRKGIHLVGDKTSDVHQQGSLIASRVGIAAHHQAHQVVRLLLDLEAAGQPQGQENPLPDQPST